MNKHQSISGDVEFGKNVKLSNYINLYGCAIGDNTKIGAFVEVQKNARIGKNCKISSHTFICEGVTIDENCFIGHAVMFINDNCPKSINAKGVLESEKDWATRFVKTHIKKNASIGSNATILGDITVGYGSIVGAGSVVTKNIPPKEVWAGNPARFLRKVK